MNQELYSFVVLDKAHHAFRTAQVPELAENYKARGLSPIERMTERFCTLTALETPHILPGEQICFLRTVKTIPDIFTPDEWDEIKKTYHVHESGYLSNFSPNYYTVIAKGLLEIRKTADEYAKRDIDAILDLTDRYRKEALRVGREDIAEVLAHVPAHGARTLREALQAFRILHFAIWLEGDYHNTVGRFDLNMKPYFDRDMAEGRLTEESALALIEDFFLSFNKDSDLYFGVQQGDNGQALMLGGIDKDGNPVFSDLSRLCLEASRNLMVIDPKINVRVDKNTPDEVYLLGSELTKAGLGFPQYSNDDIVIPGLIAMGYDEADAKNYTVAACWEFIIPGVGGDIANVGCYSHAEVIDRCLHNDLPGSETFDDFLQCVHAEARRQCDRLCGGIHALWVMPSPFYNLLMDTDFYKGGKYSNFGLHGVGVATAADSLAAIEKYIYNEKRWTKEELIAAVDADFEGSAEMLHALRYEAPKVGNNDDAADKYAVFMMSAFADALEGRVNCLGGRYRAGTGSAMFYLWKAAEIGASPDGRRKGEPFGANYSVSLFADTAGPFSVIQSMTKPDLKRCINGGPLTLEFASGMFSDEEGVSKIASLVKAFIHMGGHQLQLNAVNAEKLHDAQKHPERHRQLVVRIWGWSAYFVELDKEYQDHVIARQTYTL